jgi:hypothetical protein
MSLEDVGRYLCEQMDYVAPEDNSGCDVCPMWPMCNASDLNDNGCVNWLKEAKE